jgi:putative DNA primase/helicase
MSRILPGVLSYLDAGLSFMAIRCDGSKSPTGGWKHLQQRQPTLAEIWSWGLIEGSPRSAGVAIIGGKISGNLEIIDFDEMQAFNDFMDSIAGKKIEHVVLTLPFVKTPRGIHIYLRVADFEIPSHHPLAQHIVEEVDTVTEEYRETVKALIETRGEGGYVLSPLCPPQCHPTCTKYLLVNGDILNIPVISSFAYKAIHRFCEALSRIKQSSAPPRKDHTVFYTSSPGLSPVDDYNQRGDFEAELEQAGWSRSGSNGAMQKWRRPGKRIGTSAASGEYDGRRHFFCWSSSAFPFNAQQVYSPFNVYATLHHRGDYSAAAHALREQGFGERSRHFSGTISR